MYIHVCALRKTEEDKILYFHKCEKKDMHYLNKWGFKMNNCLNANLQFNFDALRYSNNYMYKIFGIYDYRTDTMSGIKLNLLFYQGQLGY
jgi:hypothetical protein